MLELDNDKIGSVSLGDTPLSKIFKGDTLVHQKNIVTRISGNIQFTDPRDEITLYCNYWLYGTDKISVPLNSNGDFDYIIDETLFENIEQCGNFNFNNMFFTRFNVNNDVTKVTINKLTVNPERTYISNNLVSFWQMLYYARNLTEVNFNIDCSSLTEAFQSCPLLTKVSIPKVTISNNDQYKFYNVFNNSPNISYIKCKQEVKDYFLNNVDNVQLPTNMQEGGSGTWEIVD